MKKLFLLLLISLAGWSAWAIEQDAEGTYLLGSADDWRAFAEIVNSGTNTAANARMTADIDLGNDQTMVGSGSIEDTYGTGNVIYTGVFDGDGHRLNINYNATEQFTAPFRHIQGATIKNLHVAGTITTPTRHAAGIVGGCYGSYVHSYILNCISSVVINSSYVNPQNVSYGPFYSGSWHGGIASHLFYYGQLHIEDCLFDGAINGESKATVCGGLCGMPDGTVSIVNCLQKGTFDLSDVVTGGNGAGTMSSTFSSGYASRVVVTNSYYLNPLGNVQGTQVTDIQLADGTVATALQAGRENEVWVQDSKHLTPMLKIFVNEQSESVRGDLNADGIVDVSDINIMIDMLLDQKVPDLELADLDGNDVIDVGDLNIIIDIVLGKSVDTGVQTFTVGGVSFKMVAVGGGTFLMGVRDDDDFFSNEKPVHPVTLSSYSIGQTEVTQALWQAVMGSNPSSFSGHPNRPVEMIDFADCEAFIAKLNELTGKTFRLPTEAEWEYAARGGSKSNGYKYAGSDNVDEVAWYENNAYYVGETSLDYGTHDVATKAPNELGLYDMSGNVWEWCSDWYGLYSADAQTNPQGRETGSMRVGRGGAWANVDWGCRVSFRANLNLDRKDNNIGIRLAM